MADRFIRDETLSGMANTIRKITNTDVPINFEKFAKGEVAESFYEGEYEVSGEPIVLKPLPTEISTPEEMDAILSGTPTVGAVYKYTGETTDIYENGMLYIVEAVE